MYWFMLDLSERFVVIFHGDILTVNISMKFL